MAAKGYTTEALVEAEIGKSIDSGTVPTTTQVAQWIEEVEDYIDKRAGTSFTSTTVTNEIYPWSRYNAVFSPTSGARAVETGRHDSMSGFSVNSFKLAKHPIISVSQLYINGATDDSADSWSEFTQQTGSGGDFIVDLNTGYVTFLSQTPSWGERAVKVTYYYGYSTIPNVVKWLATKLVARRVLDMKIKQQQYTTTDTVTLASLSIKKESSQAVTLLAKLDADIEDLWRQVGELVSELA